MIDCSIKVIPFNKWIMRIMLHSFENLVVGRPRRHTLKVLMLLNLTIIPQPFSPQHIKQVLIQLLSRVVCVVYTALQALKLSTPAFYHF